MDENGGTVECGGFLSFIEVSLAWTRTSFSAKFFESVFHRGTFGFFIQIGNG